MKALIEYCKGAVKSLNAQYEMTCVLGHSVTAGSVRERLIQDFLTSHLPEMTNVVSGVIFDSNDNRSKQQDIVLMLKSMPRMAFASGCDLIFQDGVVGTFEIKTNITASVLDKVALNIASVRALKFTSLAGVLLGNTQWPLTSILTIVITYDGSALSVIKDKLTTLEKAGQPDVYLDLTKGIFIRNDGILIPKNGDDEYVLIEDPAIGLARLLIILSKVSGRLMMRSVDWEKYLM